MPMPTLLTDTDCVVLAGGFGTRLRSVIGEHQKVAANVDGKPFIGRLLHWLIAYGARRVILAVGYQSEDVAAATAPFSDQLELVLSREDQPLGTAGALRLAVNNVRTSTLLVLNGDSFFNADLAALYALHAANNGVITMALAYAPDGRRFGEVNLDSDGRVLSFREKPQSEPAGAIVNAGIYFVSRDFLASLPERNGTMSLEKDVLPGLCLTGRLYGLAGKGRLVDIGTPESYQSAGEILNSEGVL
ncbi:sugar phosphate nucleotidyltransferase [Ferrovibrio terrae]|uniref:sugar phosphate nucleotidyltransferase n=1 Tax=Ferrovibrio terrae TaxID=2594003 RepID=UPI0031381D5A